MNLEAQVKLDDKNIREVIAEAEKLSGERCIEPWNLFVARVIREARANERKRIREALLSDDTIRALFTDDVIIPMPNPTATEISETRRTMLIALNKIGLTEEGDTDGIPVDENNPVQE